MRILMRIILGVIVVGIAIYAIVMAFSSGARDQAQGFVSDMTAGDFAAAMARTHPQLQSQLDAAGLETMFLGSEPYSDVSFSSISVENGRTELIGTATTATGCVSEVSFMLLADQIVNFNFTPLCPIP